MKNIILIVFSFLLFSCAEVYQPAVVSARKEATQIGLEIMKNGGNAYDAMIATHLALAVVHPTAGNIEMQFGQIQIFYCQFGFGRRVLFVDNSLLGIVYPPIY